MIARVLSLSGVLAALFFAPAFAHGQSSDSSSGGQTLYYIPHTHWEGAVFKTREEYLEMGLPNILRALQLLKAHPHFKFALDQIAYFKPFLERYPEHEADFRRFIAEGRLEIVGAMDVMPDVVKPGGELLVRQLQYGKRYCREKLGVDVKVGWFLDTFGHHSQLPQILKLAGFESFWFCRGVPHKRLPSEFFWQGIDGTEIPAYWLPGFYGLFYGPPRQLEHFSDFFKQRFNTLNSHAIGHERVGLAGVDVSEPEDYVPPLVEQFNQQPDRPFTIRYAIPSDFEAVVRKRAKPLVLKADLSPIFQGTYSSRAELKQMTRTTEERLLTAEKLSGLARWLGAPSDDTEIWRAWEPLLFNQTHDLSSGVMTDHVYDDTVSSYQFSRRLADDVINQRWDALAARVDTQGEGIPLLVFNSLGWIRSDIAEADIGVIETGMRGFHLLDPEGKAVPVQILSADRYADGGIKRAKILFVARDIPALGYSLYRIHPARAPEQSQDTVVTPKSSDVLENEYYRIKMDLAGGAMTGLLAKSNQWEVLSGPANVISRQLDKGDLWELYRGLDGASHVAMTNRQEIPKAPEALLSNSGASTNGTIRRGPVLSEYSGSHPFTNGTFATRVRLYSGLRRIDIETQLVNNGKWVRYQALFPTSIPQGRYVQEIPFGVSERASGIEFPAQHWVDYGNGERGVGILNIGLAGNLVTDGTMMLSLMRAHNLGQYGFGGGYEPGMSSESGFELGRTLTFNYSLLPHTGDWRQARVDRAGLELNHPLLVRKAIAHSGPLPKRWGFLEISHPNITLTSLAPGRDGTLVLRAFEAHGQSAPGVTIRFAGPVKSASAVNLLEDPGQPLTVDQNTVRCDMHPFEIKTIQFTLARPSGL